MGKGSCLLSLRYARPFSRMLSFEAHDATTGPKTRKGHPTRLFTRFLKSAVLSSANPTAQIQLQIEAAHGDDQIGAEALDCGA